MNLPKDSSKLDGISSKLEFIFNQTIHPTQVYVPKGVTDNTALRWSDQDMHHEVESPIKSTWRSVIMHLRR